MKFQASGRREAKGGFAVFIVLTSLWLWFGVADSFGAEIKPKADATLKNTYVWDGKTLKSKAGAALSTTWELDGKEWRTRAGASLATTWEVSGDIPAPVCALVILGINRP